MRFFVTGISGLLGAHLARRLRELGHEVNGTVHRRGAGAVAPRAWSLGDAMPPSWLEGHDVLVHCAYAPGRSDDALNLRGTRAAMAAGRAARVPHQVFLSSFSAVPRATSSYGRLKYELEQECREHGFTIARAGLVLGPGGLFARMVDAVRRWPCIPLPGGGRRPVPVIGIDDLVACLAVVVQQQVRAEHNLCYSSRPELRHLLAMIAAALQRRRWLLPVPIALLVPPVQLLRWCGLRLAVDAESLKAYAANTVEEHASHFAAFGMPEPDLRAVIAAAVQPRMPTTTS